MRAFDLRAEAAEARKARVAAKKAKASEEDLNDGRPVK
jgi:hypothetical protein